MFDFAIWILLVLVVGGLVLVQKRSKASLHIVQLEGYESENYKKWVFNNKEKAYALKKSTEPVKKALVFTDRAKRLYMTNIIISFLPMLLVLIFYIAQPKSTTMSLISLIIMAIVVAAVYYFQPITVGWANIIIKPIEESINMGFYKSAQNKIKARKDLTVIGITGSFGKTSTKFIIGTILEEKFNVLNTPESYNTPMGLSKVINNDLRAENEIFIAEMGAKVIGEIKEVAELAQPKIGVITSIGPVHIETFKNIDNIMKTKYELIDELPSDGIAVFNYDNEHIKKLADKTFKEKILYGLNNIEDLDIYADDIVVSELGSTFTIRDKDGNSERCTTKLLGRHNIYNILAGVCVSKALGLSFEEIRKGIAKIEPIPHRLNIINPGTGIIIIDDAFNSNPIGAKAALEVLGEFKEGRKIIVTPGMIELGAMEVEANREFGNDIGKVCDFVILMGKIRTQPIYDGLMDVNYNPDNIFIVNNLDEATVQIGKLARPKDVILFENDLPDNYNE